MDFAFIGCECREGGWTWGGVVVVVWEVERVSRGRCGLRASLADVTLCKLLDIFNDSSINLHHCLALCLPFMSTHPGGLMVAQPSHVRHINEGWM